MNNGPPVVRVGITLIAGLVLAGCSTSSHHTTAQTSAAGITSPTTSHASGTTPAKKRAAPTCASLVGHPSSEAISADGKTVLCSFATNDGSDSSSTLTYSCPNGKNLYVFGNIETDTGDQHVYAAAVGGKLIQRTHATEGSITELEAAAC